MSEQASSDLGSRFRALPLELRAHIFSLLLVRPVKWDSLHLESCEKRMSKTTSEYTRPTHHDLPPSQHNYICSECGPDTHERNWRHAFERGYEIYVSPWRSKWAPTQSNPFLCTNCYDDRWRSRPFPEPTNLPCLCARRMNLEVRLVCRQWNEEASEVLFSENVFAFDDCISMSYVFSAIPWPWKTFITKVSLLVPMWQEDDENTSDSQLLATTLCLLDSLNWLRYLELDAKLLNKEATASALLNCDVPSLRRVLFVVQCPYKEIYHQKLESPTYVWAELGRRFLLVGGFAEYVARSMKSQERDALSTQEIVEKVQQQRHNYHSIQGQWEASSLQDATQYTAAEDQDADILVQFDPSYWDSDNEAGGLS